MLPVVTTCAASKTAINEDAVALGPGVAVLVDGAGLPASMRRGCVRSTTQFTDLALKPHDDATLVALPLLQATFRPPPASVFRDFTT